MKRDLILASTSRYRRELLERLKLPFHIESPDVDETPLPAETPANLALRLALAKAAAIAARYPDAVVIGSDQVADLNGQSLGKPGSHLRAVEQLRRMSGHTLIFQTAVSVMCSTIGYIQQALIPVKVKFRVLSEADIAQYLALEPAYDCAGSAKSEGLGITLLESIESHDPTALIGLPLIQTSHMLRAVDLDPLQA